ncbi:MAG: hypothetical protein IT333_02865, partial [Thermomicrobiales bacterium]|nr:hypothetical protein [Thermomicrobiales bacterium]
MPEPLQVLLPLLVSVAGTGLVAGAGALRPQLAAPIAVGTATLAFITTLLSETTSAVTYNWAPTWGLQLSLATDGLARLYMLLASGIGLLVLAYSSGYLPLHLQHTGSGPERGPRFFALILLFMTAMMGLVMSQDIIL